MTWDWTKTNRTPDPAPPGTPLRAHNQSGSSDQPIHRQQPTLGDLGQLERPQDRPDIEQCVENLGARIDGVAIVFCYVADAVKVGFEPNSVIRKTLAWPPSAN